MILRKYKRMRKIKGPDFVIAGVARSGTGSLYLFIDKLPQFFLAKPHAPEPKFFSRENVYVKGVDWYLQTFFKDCKTDLIAGEKSTEYFESILFPERAMKHFPRLKVIIILRDPVERTISNYWWSFKNGHEKRSINIAIQEELAGKIAITGKINELRAFNNVSRSLYAQRLNNIFTYFPENQVLLLDYDQYIRDFKFTVNKIATFFNTTIKDFELKDRFNEAKRTESLDETTYKKLQNFFLTDIQEVNKIHNLSIKNGGVSV